MELLLTGMRKALEGGDTDQELNFGHTEFQMSVKHASAWNTQTGV